MSLSAAQTRVSAPLMSNILGRYGVAREGAYFKSEQVEFAIIIEHASPPPLPSLARASTLRHGLVCIVM